jgi:hypothetical protein
MELIDNIIKWLFAPKTIKGIIGMAVIIGVLAGDFMWWAGQDLASASSGSTSNGDVDEEAPWTYFRDLDGSYSGTLPAPSGGSYKSQDVTVHYEDFEVKENATLGFVNVTPTGTNARPDLDLRVYGPDGELVAESATEQADEYIELDYEDFNRTGPGMWIAEVDNYSSFNMGFTLTIQIDIRVPLEETDEEP